MIQPFFRQWFVQHQSRLVRLLNMPGTAPFFKHMLRILKDVPKGKPIVGLMPNHVTWLNKDGSLTTDFRTHNKFSKRVYYSGRLFWWMIHCWDMILANRLNPAWNLGYDELTSYPDANPESTSVDGYAMQYGSSNSVWSTLVGAAGNYGYDALTESYVTYITSGTVTDRWNNLARGFVLFDTSSLTGSAVISAATLSAFGYAKLDDLGITPNANVFSSAPASNTAIVAGDFDSVGTTQMANSITYSSFATTAYNDFVLEADGLANISKTDISKFALANRNYDRNIVAPAWSSALTSYLMVHTSDRSGTSYDPKLVVTYTISATQVPVMMHHYRQLMS